MSGQSTQVQGLRSQNRRVILAAIRRLGKTARVDLARETGVSPATVTSITADLVSEGLVEEVMDETQNRGVARGRPRVLLRIRPDAFLIAGAKIADDRISVTLTDFDGAEILHHSAPSRNDKNRPVREVVERLRVTVLETFERSGKSPDELSCIGLGLPGFIDATRGLAHWSPCFRERNVDFRSLVAGAFSCPVFVDNDANLAALAEQWFGYGRGRDDFIVVTIEHGVGMGIVLDGKIYRGTRGIGAEFGHTKVQVDGALCRCGQRGCLEAYVADYALLREAAIALGHERTSDLNPQAELEALFAAAKAGDAAATSIFDRAGRMLSMALANLANIFDPSLIIFSGEQMRYDFLYSQQVLDRMRSNVISIDRSPPEVRIHKWGDRIWALGAAALAMDGLTDAVMQDYANGTRSTVKHDQPDTD